SEREKINLAAVLEGCMEGYKIAYPQANFVVDISRHHIYIKGVPEYIAQLMDKLIANAVEFSYPNHPIVVTCTSVRDHSIVKVINRGPYLPPSMKDRVFDSMISVRPQEKQKQPHLGMGLHIARIIAEFHGGQIRADNLETEEGVVITLVIPLYFK
ncbi:MAG: ATP-binding protein, partial [Pseudohongiellaceae bacterium]